MSRIINEAKIKKYQYETIPGNPNIKPGIKSEVDIEFVTHEYDFTKNFDIKYIDLGGTTTLTYVFKNPDSVVTTPTLVKIELIDSLFALDRITFSNFTNLKVVAANKLEFILPDGDLKPGETITGSVDLTIGDDFDLSNSLITTTVANLYISDSEKPISVYPEDSADLILNNGNLTISKSSSIDSPVTCGTTIPYTVVITNIGNIKSKILTGDFEDIFPENTRYEVNSLVVTGISSNKILTDNADETKATKIYNVSPIELEPKNSIVIKFNLIVICN